MSETSLLILGATGLTGRYVLNMALDKGYRVTALVRDPVKLSITHNHLKIIKGNVLNNSQVEHAILGTETVISTLGVGKSLRSHALMYKAINNIIPAMQKNALSRLIWLSAFGVGPTYSQANFLQRLAYRLPLKNIFRDKERADALIRNSNLKYTIVCPVVLTNGPVTGNYLAGETLRMKGLAKISRGDVAHFIIGQVADTSFIRKTAILKNP